VYIDIYTHTHTHTHICMYMYIHTNSIMCVAGKYIDINFDETFGISGAKIDTYLLERSRVVSQQRGVCVCVYV
jgi:hypothetical protein